MQQPAYVTPPPAMNLSDIAATMPPSTHRPVHDAANTQWMSPLDTLITWLNTHPNWILLSIAVLAFLESLAVVGILVPGIALLMAASTAAGGAGVNVWHMLLMGFVGAVAGDGLSFLLGYHYHAVIRRIPPFKSHPEWIEKGEAFFRRYGLMGIVLGRFVGPVRPVMPMVAGFMEMSPLKFFTINVLSALAWSPFYLMPGYLVGQSIEGQGALNTSHLVFLLGAILLGWLLAQFAQRLHSAMHLRETKLRLSLNVMTAFLLVFIVLGVSVKWGLWLAINDRAAHWAFGLRHDWLEEFFVGLTIMGEYPAMTLWAVFVGVALLLQRNRYATGLWTGFVLLGLLLMELAKRGFAIARPELVAQPPTSFAYPSGHSAMILVFMGLLVSFALPSINARRHQLILSCTGVLVVLVASARLYLGVHWLTDIIGGWLLAGFLLALFYNVVLRKPFPRINPWPLLLASVLAWLVNLVLFVLPQFSHWLARYQPLSLS